MRDYLRSITTIGAAAAGMMLACTAGSAWARQPAAPYGSEMLDASSRTPDVLFTTRASGLGVRAAGDHIIEYQCADGGWGWPHAPCPTTTYQNIGPPIALGLLNAYALTEDSTYLDAAVDAGDFNLTSQFTNGEASFGAFMPYFLLELSAASGDSQYAIHAETYFFDELVAGTYGPDDLDMDGWVTYIEDYRAGTWVNLIPWEFSNVVVASQALGTPDQTDRLVQGILDGLDTLDSTSPGSVYRDLIGIAGAVRGLSFAGVTTFPAINSPLHSEIDTIDNLSDLVDVLLAHQNADGSWYWESNLTGPTDGDKDMQQTAYAVLALLAAQDAGVGTYDTEIADARDWIRGQQDPSDGSYWSYGDKTGKNTEVIAEGLNAVTPEARLVVETTDCQADADGTLAGYQIEYELWVRDLTGPATGYQAMLEYDTSAMTFVAGAPSAYDNTVFNAHIVSIPLAELFDGTTGTLTLDGNDSTQVGTSSDTLLATLVFTVTDETCSFETVDFDLNSPTGFVSEVSYQGLPLDTGVESSPGATVDTVAPTITCPPDLVFNADAGGCTKTITYLETFDDPVCTASSQTPDCWYTDRFAPAVFENATFLSDERLKHGVDAADWQSTGLPNFYNTQGRKYDIDMPVGTTLAADVYVPASWQTSVRSLGMWATTFNAGPYISGYPILNVVSNDPDDDLNPTPANPSPRFRYYTQDIDQDTSNGYQAGYVEMGPVLNFDEWYRLEIELTPTYYEFRVVRVSTATTVYSAIDLITFGSNRFGNIILQAYNFGETYDGYWDNVTIGPKGPVVVDNCTDTFVTYERSDNAALTLDDPFPSGVTTVTWTATDYCGNVDTCDQTVTVEDVNDVQITVALLGCDGARDALHPLRHRRLRRVHQRPDELRRPRWPGHPLSRPRPRSRCPAAPGPTSASRTSSTRSGPPSAHRRRHVLHRQRGRVARGRRHRQRWRCRHQRRHLAPVPVELRPPETADCPWNGTRDADFNNDTVVNSLDYAFISDNWLTQTSCACTTAMLDPGDPASSSASAPCSPVTCPATSAPAST
jgi:hypothetical protein